MPGSFDLLNDLDLVKLREHVKRARRLAAGLTQDADRMRLIRYADQLEQEANRMEVEAAAPPAAN
jgi:hypothetical protein